MSHPTAATSAPICCAPSCRSDGSPLAPVPLCSRHLRQTYEFAASLVDDRAVLALAEIHSDVLKNLPAVHRPMIAAAHYEARAAGFVYFIRFADRIKIGWSGQPAQRIAALPHDEVLAIVPGTMQDEHRYHAQFARQHLQGEWFKASKTLLDFVAAL